MNTIEQEVARIISRAALIPESEVQPEKELAALGVDSLDHIDCVLRIERQFQIEFEREELPKIRTVQDLVDAAKRAGAKTPVA